MTQLALSNVPKGAALNALLQRRVTHSVPAPALRFAEMVDAAHRHVDAFTRALDTSDLGSLRGFELGGGWHLGTAIAAGALGVGSQVVVDRERLASDDLLLHSFEALSRQLPESGRLASIQPGTEVCDALASLGIDYRAPADAQHTELPDDCVDFVYSTSTLEHIPAEALGPLFAECRRVLRPGGVMSHLIDYKDHYAGFDSTISPLNFLRYSEQQWRKYNPSLHYQSRLRHRDHVDAIRRAGFTIEEVDVVPGTDEDVRWLQSVELHPGVVSRPPEEIAIRDAHLVCQAIP